MKNNNNLGKNKIVLLFVLGYHTLQMLISLILTTELRKPLPQAL